MLNKRWYICTFCRNCAAWHSVAPNGHTHRVRKYHQVLVRSTSPPSLTYGMPRKLYKQPASNFNAHVSPLKKKYWTMKIPNPAKRLGLSGIRAAGYPGTALPPDRINLELSKPDAPPSERTMYVEVCREPVHSRFRPLGMVVPPGTGKRRCLDGSLCAFWDSESDHSPRHTLQ